MSWASWTEARSSRSRHESNPRFYAYNQDDTPSSNWGRQQWYHDEDPFFTRGGQQRPRRRHNEDKVSPPTTWGAHAWYHRPEDKNSAYTWSEDDAETRSGNSRGSRALSPEASASWPSDDDERRGSESVTKKSQMDGRACGQALLNMVKKSEKRESTAPGHTTQGAARHAAPKAKQQAEPTPVPAPSSSTASAPSASAALKQLVRASPQTAVSAAPADTSAPSASAVLARLIGEAGTDASSPGQAGIGDSAALATSGAAEELIPSVLPEAPSAPPLSSPSTAPVAAAATSSTMPSAMLNPQLRPVPVVSASSSQMLPQAPAMLLEAPAVAPETWVASGSRFQGSTKLRSSASMFVPGQSSPSAAPSQKSLPAALRTNGGQAKGPGKEMLANLISQTFGTDIWNVMMVNCEDYTGRSYTAVELTLPMCSEWSAAQVPQDQAALQNLRWNLNSVEGVQSAELSADGTALQMEYCPAGKERLCWDFAHHGFCPRPACRWQHVALENFVITVLLRASPVQKPIVAQGTNLGQAGNTMCVILQPNGQPAAQMAVQPVFQVVPQQVGKAIVMIPQPLAQQSTLQPLSSGDMMLMAGRRPIVQQMPLVPVQPSQSMVPSAGLPMQRFNGSQHQEITAEDPDETSWQDCAAPKHEGPAFFDNEADAENVNGTLDSAKRVSWADLEDEDGEEIDLKQWAGPELQ